MTAAPPAPPTIGFLGLGFMGDGMVRCLHRAGYPLVLWNRTAAKATALQASLAGAQPVEVADAPAAVAARCDVLLLCLATPAATSEVLQGLLAVPLRGKLVVDHGTVSRAFSRETHALVAEAGGSFLDAPISGGPDGAAQGTLSIMCGGDEAVFARAKPVLNAMGSLVVHFGDAGAGTAVKLVNQQLVACHALAACEAMLYAESMGLGGKRREMVDLLASSFGRSAVLARVGPAVVDALESGEELPGPFLDSNMPIRLVHKDVGFVLADDHGAAAPHLPATTTARGVLDALVQQGHGDAHFGSMFWHLQQQRRQVEAGAAAEQRGECA